MIKRKIRFLAILLAAVMLLSAVGCGMPVGQSRQEPITVYLWSCALMDEYAPYIQSQLPDVPIEFVVGNNDLDFYKFLNENGALPDIITNRRFSLNDAKALQNQLIDLSETEVAASYHSTYLDNYRNSDGSVNWLPLCGEVDALVANKALFDRYGIPLPTDYNSFVSACREFEKHDIRGFVSDFDYDYTCLEILQGLSISELTSLNGEIWRSNYEDPDNGITGLDEAVWPGVFERMEQFIKDARLTPEDISLSYDAVQQAFDEGKVAMIRDTGSAISLHAGIDGIQAVLLPYFCQDGQSWLLTYPSFQIALNKDLETNGRKNDALRILEVMLSESGQNFLAENKDVISYKKDVRLSLREELQNLQPYVESNHLYIRLASNEFFSVSRDVVQKMISGKYDAKEAYTSFHSQLQQSHSDPADRVAAFGTEYSRRFQDDGGSRAISAIANTLREMYSADLLISPSYNFTSPVLSADYTEKMLGYMIMPNSCAAYICEALTGAQVKELVRVSVEGPPNAEEQEGVFLPFNRASLPVVSGMTMEVTEENGRYKLKRVLINGAEPEDSAVYRVAYLNPPSYYAETVPQIFPKETADRFIRQEARVRAAWTTYIKAGHPLLAPTDYIFVE